MTDRKIVHSIGVAGGTIAHLAWPGLNGGAAGCSGGAGGGGFTAIGIEAQPTGADVKHATRAILQSRGSAVIEGDKEWNDAERDARAALTAYVQDGGRQNRNPAR